MARREASAGVAEAMSDFASTVEQPGIDSVTLTTHIPGEPDQSVVIDKEAARRIKANAKRIRKEARPN